MIDVSTRPWLWSLVIKPTRRPWDVKCSARRRRAVVLPAPRNPPTMTYSALISSLVGIDARMPVRQHFVDRRVENRDVPVNVDRIRRRLTLQSIQPAVAVGIGFGERDVLPERCPFAEKKAGPGREHARHGFQPFDKANLISHTDGCPWLYAELELDDISEHSRRELREPDPPDSRRHLEQPVMSGRIPPVARQMRRESRSAIVHALLAWHAHVKAAFWTSR